MAVEHVVRGRFELRCAASVRCRVGIEDVVSKEKAKYLVNNFFLLITMSQWYLGYVGLNKILLKLISQLLKWSKLIKTSSLLDEKVKRTSS